VTVWLSAQSINLETGAKYNLHYYTHNIEPSKLELKFFYSDSTSNYLSIANTLNHAVSIGSFYESQNYDCGFGYVGIEEQQSKKPEQAQVYPNPNTETFTITLNQELLYAKIAIFNYLGIKVFESNLHSSTQTPPQCCQRVLYLSNHGRKCPQSLCQWQNDSTIKSTPTILKECCETEGNHKI